MNHVTIKFLKNLYNLCIYSLLQCILTEEIIKLIYKNEIKKLFKDLLYSLLYSLLYNEYYKTYIESKEQIIKNNKLIV